MFVRVTTSIIYHKRKGKDLQEGSDRGGKKKGEEKQGYRTSSREKEG